MRNPPVRSKIGDRRSDNFPSMADKNSGMTAREARRRRRIRQQTAYYTITVIFLIVLGIGGFFGYRYVRARFFPSQVAPPDEVQTPDPQVQAPDAGVTEEAEKTPEEQMNDEINRVISEMTLQDKVSQLFLVTPGQLTGMTDVTRAGETTQAALKQYPVAGIVYSEGNLSDRRQLTDLLSTTKQMSRYPLFLAAEETGGANGSEVAKALSATAAMSPKEIGAGANTSIAQEAGDLMGAYLKQAGFNLNMAPVANIALDPEAEDAFGTDAQMVSGMSVAMVKGLRGQGIASCVGRFPLPCAEDAGGMAGMNATQQTMDELENEAFLPFRDCITAGCEIVMLSNIAAPRAVGGNAPCTFSETIIHDELRSTLGYGGIIMSAPLDQDAIMGGYTADHAAVAAIAAGCDLLYRPEHFELAVTGVMDAVENGVLTEERIDQSLRRVLRVKYKMGI